MSYQVIYRVVQNKVYHHAVCEHNLRKLLLRNGVILVVSQCSLMPGCRVGLRRTAPTYGKR